MHVCGNGSQRQRTARLKFYGRDCTAAAITCVDLFQKDRHKMAGFMQRMTCVSSLTASKFRLHSLSRPTISKQDIFLKLLLWVKRANSAQPTEIMKCFQDFRTVRHVIIPTEMGKGNQNVDDKCSTTWKSGSSYDWLR
jgi:hypothetical protein